MKHKIMNAVDVSVTKMFQVSNQKEMVRRRQLMKAFHIRMSLQDIDGKSPAC